MSALKVDHDIVAALTRAGFSAMEIAQRLGDIRRDRRRDRGWPDSTAEERERNLAAFVDSLEDA